MVRQLTLGSSNAGWLELGLTGLRRALGASVFVGVLAACGPSNGGAGKAIEDGSPTAGSGAASGAGAPAGSGGQGGSSGVDPQGGSGARGDDPAKSGGATNTGGALSDVPIRSDVGLPIPVRGQVLSAQALAQQLASYDPGSLFRCAVADDARYQAAIDALGGVTWGYNVRVIVDESEPRYLAGVERPLVQEPSAASGDGGGGVEIATADIVAVTEAAALFYADTHGVLIVDIEDGTPRFHCAAQLPGRVGQFFFHRGHLVVMTKSQDSRRSHLLHFRVDGTELHFTEAIDLGPVDVLDSRRFNDKLVFYTTFDPAQPANGAPNGGGQPPQQGRHRALRVYELGDTLEEELYDTLIDTAPPDAQLAQEVNSDTPLGSLVNEARWFGRSMWASDHYFVVTEELTKTFLDEWTTRTYPVCTESHVTEVPYQHCWTEYETRPNPDYVEPDNSGGDRACSGLTLSDCLIEVARVSNKTIQVPVGRKCEERVYRRWVCDRSEQRSTTYPTFRYEAWTRLFIYEYTDAGFVRVDSQVHEVSSDLSGVAPDAEVDVITTSAETYDLAVPGTIQTLQFQNGYLYVISQGVLQVYAMGGSSIVRTATLPVVNETLQASLFSQTRLFLSDFGWSGGDHSTLRVINLENPAFPRQDGATHQLPGGHRSIIAADAGIFTIGSVRTFMGQTVNALKLGLFSDPYADETAYSILGTDLKNAWLGLREAELFDAASQRLLLPYAGRDEQNRSVQRVGISRVVPGSILSEGAVVIPEPAQRVRPLPAGAESYLTFARNSIEWLTPEGEEWKAEPVLEYFEPFALYARAPDADRVELQRLGERCRLYFASVETINQREDGTYSEEFFCTGAPRAYDRRFIFSSQYGLELTDDRSFRELTADEVEDTLAKIAARPYCLLALEIVDDVTIDPDQRPPHDRFTCMSPEEYTELRNRLWMEQRQP